MNIKEALIFLRENQPLPDDSEITEEQIQIYDNIRKFALKNPNPEFIPLFLGSFGRGDGLGVYKLIPDIFKSYDKKEVLPHLISNLKNSSESLIFWNLHIAIDFMDSCLVPYLIDIVFKSNFDCRFFALMCLEEINFENKKHFLEKIIQHELHEEIVNLAKDFLSDLHET